VAGQPGVQVEVLQEPHQQLLRTREPQAGADRAGWQADFNHPEDWYDNLFGKLAGCPDSTAPPATRQRPVRSRWSPRRSHGPARSAADVRPGRAGLAPRRRTSRSSTRRRAYMIKPYVRGAGANNLLEYTWNRYQVLQH